MFSGRKESRNSEGHVSGTKFVVHLELGGGASPSGFAEDLMPGRRAKQDNVDHLQKSLSPQFHTMILILAHHQTISLVVPFCAKGDYNGTVGSLHTDKRRPELLQVENSFAKRKALHSIEVAFVPCPLVVVPRFAFSLALKTGCQIGEMRKNRTPKRMFWASPK